jgi:PBP1b-binding outer membrane lipoprotein LpoB
VFRYMPVLVAMLLTGCAGSNGPEQSQQPRMQAAATETDDDTNCQSQGFPPGSSDYVQCRKKLDFEHIKAEMGDTYSEREGTIKALLGRPPF